MSAVRFRLPLSSVSPLRDVAPDTVTLMPDRVAPFGSVTVMAIPERVAARGSARLRRWRRRFAAGWSLVGAWPLCSVVACAGLAGVLGAWALAAMTLTTTKLNSRDMRMEHIIHRSRAGIIPEVRQGYPDWD